MKSVFSEYFLAVLFLLFSFSVMGESRRDSFLPLGFSLTQDYGVTEDQISEAAGIFLTKVPEFGTLIKKLKQIDLAIGTYGGTSRELMQELITGIRASGSFEAYLRKLQAMESISYLDWHRLGSDLDLILLPTSEDGLDGKKRSEASQIIREVFPESLFYKNVDIIWPDQHFKEYPVMFEHFEATSNIIVSESGFVLLPELEGVVDGRKVNFCKWGVTQFLKGEFDFRISPDALVKVTPDKTLIQVLRWVRYLSEFAWMKAPQATVAEIRRLVYSLTKNHREEILNLFKMGNSLKESSTNHAEKIVLALEKLQLYSLDTLKTHEYLKYFGITQLVEDSGIAHQRLLKPLRDRTSEQDSQAKAKKPIDKSITLYHRTHIQAAQSIGMGALWLSDNQTIIKGRTTTSALSEYGFYASTEFGSLSYGDYYVKLILSPQAVEGVDFVVNGDFYSILTRQALENPESKEQLLVEKVTSSSLILNNIELLKRKLSHSEYQAILRVLFILLRPASLENDRNLLKSVFSSFTVDRERLLELFFSNTQDLNAILGSAPSAFVRQILDEYLKSSYSEAHARIFETLVLHPELLNIPSNQQIYKNLIGLLEQENSFQARLAANSNFLEKLKILDPSLRKWLIVQNWEVSIFDLSNSEDRHLLIKAMARLPNTIKLQKVIFKIVRPTPLDHQMSFISDLTSSQEMSPFQIHLFLSYLLNSDHLAISYYSFSKPRAIGESIDNLRDMIIDRSSLTRDELRTMYHMSGVLSSSSTVSEKEVLTKLWDILILRLRLKTNDLINLPGLSIEEKALLFHKLFNLKNKPQVTLQLVDWSQIFQKLAHTLITRFVNKSLGPREMLEYFNYIPEQFIPQLSDDIKVSLYDLKFDSSGNESVQGSQYRALIVKRILTAQESLPFSVFSHIVKRCLQIGIGRESDASVISHRTANSRELAFLYAEFMNVLKPEPSIYDSSMIIPEIPVLILSDRLYRGIGWTDALYDRFASLWEYAGQRGVINYLRAAPDFPVDWQKNIALDITSGDTERMSLALALLSSRKHPIRALEQLFRTQFEGRDSKEVRTKLQKIIENLVYRLPRSNKLYFSRLFWSWLFTHFESSVQDFRDTPLKIPGSSANPAIEVFFEFLISPSHTNAPDWVYRRVFQWLDHDLDLGKKLLQNVAGRSGDQLHPSIKSYLPKKGSLLFDSLDYHYRLYLDEIRISRPPASCSELLLAPSI